MSVGGVILLTLRMIVTVLAMYFLSQWFDAGFFEVAIVIIYGFIMTAAWYFDGLLIGTENDACGSYRDDEDENGKELREVDSLEKKFYVYFKRATWHFIGWNGFKVGVSPDYTIRRLLSIFHETSCDELLPILKLNGVLVAKEWLDMPLKDIGVFDRSNNECYLYICDETPEGYTKWFAGETRCSPSDALR